MRPGPTCRSPVAARSPDAASKTPHAGSRRWLDPARLTVTGLSLKGRAQRPVGHSRVAEALVARGLGVAPRKDRHQGLLSIERQRRAQCQLRGHDTVQDHAADTLRETPQVVLRDARAVGSAVQIDDVVAERFADAVQVPHGDAGRVERDVRARFERRQAAPRLGGDDFIGGAHEYVFVHLAIQARSTAPCRADRPARCRGRDAPARRRAPRLHTWRRRSRPARRPAERADRGPCAG